MQDKPDNESLSTAADLIKQMGGRTKELPKVKIAELERLLLLGTEAIEEYEVKDKEGNSVGKIKIRPLSAAEIQEAFIRAAREVSKIDGFEDIWTYIRTGKTSGNKSIIESGMAMLGIYESIQIIYFSARDFHEGITPEIISKSPLLFELSSRIREISGYAVDSGTTAASFRTE